MGEYKVLKPEERELIIAEVKMMLHASRDCQRNTGTDTTVHSYTANDSYYAEAFGVMRGLVVLGYGYFGSCNLNALEERGGGKKMSTIPEHNLRWWFENISREVLEEEGFRGNNVCEHCMERYGKDSRYCLTGDFKERMEWRKNRV